MTGSIFFNLGLIPFVLAVAGTHDYTSKVNGLTYSEYMNTQISFDVGSAGAGMLGYGFSYEDNDEEMFDNFGTGIILYTNSLECYRTMYDEIDMSCGLYMIFEPYTYQNNKYALFRFFAPSNDYINALEFSCSDSFYVTCGDFQTGDYLIAGYTPTYTDNNRTYSNYMLLQDGFSVSTSNNHTANGSEIVPYLYQYCLCFNANNFGQHYNISFDLHLLNGGDRFTEGYNIGYTEGYNDGNSSGYSHGYHDGLEVSSNTSFGALMNSIADTPLRFLYGLFNFDLFGMNVLVIIMSLLTGLVVVGVIRKIWK